MNLVTAQSGSYYTPPSTSLSLNFSLEESEYTILSTRFPRILTVATPRSVTMADSNDSRAVVPVARSARPVSETLLNEKVNTARDLSITVCYFSNNSCVHTVCAMA